MDAALSSLARCPTLSRGSPAARIGALLLTLGALSAGTVARAQPVAVRGSPDIHVDQSGTLVGPGDVSEDIQVQSPGLIDLGPLPDGAEVTAYSPYPPFGTLFVLEDTAALSGGVTARPRDLVLWDGLAFSLALDGGSVGIPDGVAIDALSFLPGTNELWLSFDTTVNLAGTVLRDADVFDSALNLVFDATGAGVPPGMDVDGVSHVEGAGDLLLSFDVGGTLGGVTFADEDVLRYDPAGHAWSLEVDASASQPDWGAADLDAFAVVPEPGRASGLLPGLALLCGLAWRRRGRPARVPRPRSRRVDVARPPGRSWIGPLAAATALLAAATSHASDGVLEIHHACATDGGCFAGDTPGYPVSIGQAGSYLLTSNLFPAGADGIEIAAGIKAVTIDLNGFRIDGTGSGAGDGIRGGFGASAIVVRNGTIVGMGGDGINIGGSAVVESVHVLANGDDGIDVNQTSMVSRCRVVGNTGFGIHFSDRSSGYSGIVFSSNGLGSVLFGRASGQNVCDDGRCNRWGLRRYYLTQTTHPGDQALSACAAGYHMASLWEIHDPSHLLYDTDLGVTIDDSGSGPPVAVKGWIRGGVDAENCNDWQSTTGMGTTARLPQVWTVEPFLTKVDPWDAGAESCTYSLAVWCVEE